MRKIVTNLLAPLALLAAVAGGRAAEPVPVQVPTPVPTRITVEGMHCMSCAKKIAAQVQAVPGVAAVQASVEASLLGVVPAARQNPSPRALWEAVEKAGYKPVRLEGPAGTFTSRPQS